MLFSQIFNRSTCQVSRAEKRAIGPNGAPRCHQNEQYVFETEMFLIIPVSVASGERSFSRLKPIKEFM